MAALTKIEGQEITLGGEVYVLPPIPLKKVSGIKKLMQGGDFMEDEAYVDALVDAVHVSLHRNYPGIERSVVEDNLDLLNFKDVMKAFMVVNGFETKTAESGEATTSQ